MRTCTTCKETLPLTDFYKYQRSDRKHKTIRSTCKTCDIAAINENKAVKKEYYDKWYAEYSQRPEFQLRVRTYRKSKRAKKLQKLCRDFYRLNPEWVAKQRAKDKERYHRLKNDPVWLANRRECARRNYHKRKERAANVGN